MGRPQRTAVHEFVPSQRLIGLIRIDGLSDSCQHSRCQHPAEGYILRDHQCGIARLNPMRMLHNASPARLEPVLGADTYHVLTEIVGMSADDVAEYAAKGAIE